MTRSTAPNTASSMAFDFQNFIPAHPFPAVFFLFRLTGTAFLPFQFHSAGKMMFPAFYTQYAQLCPQIFPHLLQDPFFQP